MLESIRRAIRCAAFSLVFGLGFVDVRRARLPSCAGGRKCRRDSGRDGCEGADGVMKISKVLDPGLTECFAIRVRNSPATRFVVRCRNHEHFRQRGEGLLSM